MTEKKEGKKDYKYFYAIVLITFAIVGVVIWQIFFVSDLHHISPDSGFEETPDVDLVFLDSYAFGGLDHFERGDVPLLPWKQVRNENPFQTPRVPRDRDLRRWWAVFNIELRTETESLIGQSPDMIEGYLNPTLILFEGRWYEIKWGGNQEGVNLKIVGDDDEVLIESDGEDFLEFQASAEMSEYRSDEGAEGIINIITDEDYDSGIQDFEEYQDDTLLMIAGSDLSNLHNRIRSLEDEFVEEEIRRGERVYSELEGEFREIERKNREGELREESLQAEIGEFRSMVSLASDNLAEIITGEASWSDLKGEDTDMDDFEGNELLEEAREDLLLFRDDLEALEDEAQRGEAREVYYSLDEELQNLEESYEAGQIDEGDLFQEVENFYIEAESLIAELDFL